MTEKIDKINNEEPVDIKSIKRDFKIRHASDLAQAAQLDESKFPNEEIGVGMYNERAVQRLKWTIVDNERTAIEESVVKEINITYEILPNQRETNGKQDGYILNRIANDYQYADGILGLFEDSVGICCGISSYSAIGLPPNGKCNGDIEYIKYMAETDLRNLEKGIDNVFVDKFRE